MKKGGLIFVFLILFFAGFSVAETIADNIPIQIQTLDASNNIVTGTFTFKIDISDSSTCSPVLYSDVRTLTTDSRGIVSYNLPDVDLNFDEQYWFCYYRDSILKSTIKAARVPYAFRAKNVSLSGVAIDKNLEMGSYNVSANYFIGDGSQLTNLNIASESDPYWTGNQTNYFNKTDIISFGYYNLTNFDINNYYLNSNPFGFYNSTTLPSFTEDLWNANYSNYLTLFNWNKTYADTLYYGIGNPSGFIDWSKAVNGTLALSSSLNNYLLKTDWNSTNTSYYLATNPFGFYNETTLPVTSSVWNRSSTNVFLANTGDNVGIGTSSPLAPLSVRASDDTGANIVSFLSSTNAHKFQFYQEADGDASLYIGNAAEIVLQESGDSYFNGGNVGIGTSSPTSLLHVYQNDAEILAKAGVTIEQDGDGDSEVQFLLTDARRWTMGIDNSDGDKFKISEGGDLADDTFLTIGTTGNVGIGTTTPDTKLTVSGDLLLSGASGYRKLWLNANGDLGTSARVGSIQKDYTTSPYNMNIYASYGLSGSSSPITFYRDSVNPTMIIDSSGNVGIGTTSPVVKLQVDGNVRVNGGEGGYLSLFNTGQNQWQITTDGTALNFYETRTAGDRLTLATGGNVGIGTSSPTQKLDISGSDSTTLGIGVRFGNTYSTEGAWTIASRGDLATDSLVIRENTPLTSDRVTIQTGGNVGIGISSPTNTLHISKSTSGASVDIVHSIPTIGATTGINFAVTNDPATSRKASILFERTSDYGRGNLHFAINNVAGSTNVELADAKMTITSTGNVGIGTTTPTEKLDVVGHILSSTVKTDSTNKYGRFGTTHYTTSEEPFYGMMTASTSVENTLRLGGGTAWGNSATNIKFYTASNITTTTGTERMIIDSSGNVGIGTTSPDNKLTVVGEIDKVVSSTGTTASPVEEELVVSKYTDFNHEAGIYDINSFNTNHAHWLNFKVTQTSSDTQIDAMTIYHNGNIGIGTSSPLSKLEVVGEVRTTDDSGSARMWGEGRPGTVRYGTTGVESGLCNNGDVNYGISRTSTEWGSAAAACPVGTWVCTNEEVGISECLIQYPSNLIGYICSGGDISFSSGAFYGWLADANSTNGEGYSHWRSGATISLETCVTIPVWCCSD